MDNSQKVATCLRMRGEKIRLMSSGLVILVGSAGRPIQLHRGMPVSSREGRQVGWLAALAFVQGGRAAHCLILSRLPQENCYHSVPVDWIQAVRAEEILLAEAFDVVMALPEWHPA